MSTANSCRVHSRSALSLHAAGAAATEGRGQREVNVLLAVHAHQEGGHVHDLLAHAANWEQEEQQGTSMSAHDTTCRACIITCTNPMHGVEHSP